MNIFVGNLPREVVESDLKKLFSEFGEVIRVKIIRDSYTGASKGYGFIEMPSQSDARRAINKLDSMDVKGRKLVVNEARNNSSLNNVRNGLRGELSDQKRNW